MAHVEVNSIAETVGDGLRIRWKCGCRLIAQRRWEEGEIVAIGSKDMPLTCPEHSAPFEDWVLPALLLNNTVKGG